MRKHNGLRWQWPSVATSSDATQNCLASHWNRKRSRNGLFTGLGKVVMSWRDLWPACFLRGSSGKFPEGVCTQLLPPVFYSLHLELVVPSTISSCTATSFTMDFQLPYISKTKDQWYAEAVPCCSLLQRVLVPQCQRPGLEPMWWILMCCSVHLFWVCLWYQRKHIRHRA